jgi:uncharacterized protein (UPF0335 family)
MHKRQIEQLQGAITELERLEDARREIGEQSKLILDTAKEHGLNTKAIKEVLKLRRQETEERTAFESLRDQYCHALGVELEAPLLARMEA